MALPRAKLVDLPPGLRLTAVETWLRRRLVQTRNLGKILEQVQQALARPSPDRIIPLAQGLELKLSPRFLRIQKAKGAFRRPARRNRRKTGKNRKP
jgi:hypothetical protein